MLRGLLFSICLLIVVEGFAQAPQLPYSINAPDLPDWVHLLYSDTANESQIQAAFEAYYQQHPFEKNQHTQYFKRWKRQLARAPHWSGMSDRERHHYRRQQAVYLQQRASNNGRNLPAWQSLGPFDFDKEAASASYACGAAHVYVVRQAPSNPSVLYAGTATAGVWHSSDKGINWTLASRDLPMTTVRALAIDPNSPAIIYAASDLDGHLYKSTNSGSTWSIAGDTAFQNQHHNIHDIVVHPQFGSLILVASDQGLFRSTNSGSSWTQLLTGNVQEIEWHPHLPQIVYAVRQIGTRTEFYKSTDSGASFVHKPTGWPVPATAFDEQRRTEIAVSPADSNRIYALCAGAVGFGSGLYGIYVSQDAGETWTSSCCGAHLPNYLTPSNPNLLHWLANGMGNGGQYYYDLALGVSPSNADSVWVAGINLWVSGDGAQSFTCPAQWNESRKSNYVHADIHDIQAYAEGLWVACDGGIFYSDNQGQRFERRQYGIQGTDFWGFGAGWQDGSVLLGGTFHNGTLLRDGTVYQNGWLSTDGGDNFRGYVHPFYRNRVYSDYGQTELSGNRLTANFTQPFGKLPHATSTVGFSGSLVVHPRTYRTLYSTVFDELWRSQNDGTDWELLHDFGSGLLSSLEIAWSDPSICYLHYHPADLQADRLLYRSQDSGRTWVDITPDSMVVPSDRWVSYDLTVDARDANHLWAARVSKYEGQPILDGVQVLESLDGGVTWQNITTADLNGVYITNIEHQKGSNGGLYLGTRRGVYYTNDTLSQWLSYSQNLPARTQSVQLVPFYGGQRLRNGTNRSVYEVPFYGSARPVAQISVDKTHSYCPRDTFYFANQSAAPSTAQFQWTFQGGQPSQSTLEHPRVVFPQAGQYAVTLVISDATGTDTLVLPQFITVEHHCAVDTVPGYALQLSDRTAYAQTPPLQQHFSILTMAAWVKPDSLQAPLTGLLSHSVDSVPAGLLLHGNNELLFQWPGASWNWRSGLIVTPDVWSHVALVITPDSAVVYVNGVGSVFRGNLLPLHWTGGLVIGRYADWFGRTFQGEIEEVVVWNQALPSVVLCTTQHLVHYPQSSQPLHYYQCNANTPTLQDRAGNHHAQLHGTARRQRSTAPVGGGYSQIYYPTAVGQYTLDTAQVQLYSATVPVASTAIIATRLHVPPDQSPRAVASGGYWVINPYGSPDSLTIDSLTLKHVQQQLFGGDRYQLYQRPLGAHGATWGSPLDSQQVYTPRTALTFRSNTLTWPIGQLLMTQDSAHLLTVPQLPTLSSSKKAQVYPNPIQQGQTLQIRLPTDETYQFQLYSSDGRLVYEEAISQQPARLALPFLVKGWYGFRLTSTTRQQAGWLQVQAAR